MHSATTPWALLAWGDMIQLSNAGSISWHVTQKRGVEVANMA